MSTNQKNMTTSPNQLMMLSILTLLLVVSISIFADHETEQRVKEECDKIEGKVIGGQCYLVLDHNGQKVPM